MKKAGAILIISLLVLLILPIALAVTDLPEVTTFEDPDDKEPFQSKDQKAKEKAKELAKKANEIPSREVRIPGYLQPYTKVIFGFKENPTLQTLIVTLLIWLILVFMLIGIMQGFSPFSDTVSTILGILLVIVATVLGITRKIGELAVSAGNLITDNPIGSSLLAIFILMLIAAPLIRLLKKKKEQKEKDEDKKSARELGRNIGATGEIIKSLKKVSKKSKT